MTVSIDGRAVPATTPDGPVPGGERRTIAITIQHPAHVHFFKHAIRALEAEGHAVAVFARDKEVTVDLLRAYGIDHTVLEAAHDGSFPSLLKTQLAYEYRLWRAVRSLDPDVVAAVGGVAAAHVSRLVDARGVVFYDTEHARLVTGLAFPFADEVWTPECYHGDVTGTHVRYPAYHELAYLHPDRFEPDADVVHDVGLDPEDTFVVFRTIAWEASHDGGHGGFDDVEAAISRLEATGAEVLVSAEGEHPPGVEDRQVDVRPHRMHDLLAYADLFVGEGATMAAESAVLGTPALYVNSLRMGYTDEIEARYGLLYNFQGAYRHLGAIEKATAILRGEEDRDWEARRARLLSEKTDATEVVLRALRADG